MAQAIGNLAVGSIVIDTGSTNTFYDKTWTVVARNHSGYPSASTTLMAEFRTSLPFDGAEPSNTNSLRASYGNERYSYSNILQWLNASGSNWYSPKHSYDSLASAYSGVNGFKGTLSSALQSTLNYTTVSANYWTEETDGVYGTESVTSMIFLPSLTELGYETSRDNQVAQGSSLGYFTSATIQEAVTRSAVWQRYSDGRTPTYISVSYVARTIPGSLTFSPQINAMNSFNTESKRLYVLINVPNTTIVSSMTSSSKYQLFSDYATAPTMPVTLTIPTTIEGGKTLSISWGTSTDTNSNLSGYSLERSVNSGSYSVIYTGTALTYTDSILSSYNTVQYRVRAYDSTSLYSSYNTSSLRTVTNNTAPTISGSDTNLGTQTLKFDTDYTITDPDTANTLTVTEKIDDVIKRTFTATTGTRNTFSITSDEWLKLLNGNHTLTITVNDGVAASVSRVYTFTKSVTSLEFQMTAPISSEKMITKGIMNVTRSIPTGAAFTAYATNNGFDESPAWIDVTAQVISGAKFFFTNETKTAENWGYNFKISINRGSAIGDCYVSSIGGNFE